MYRLRALVISARAIKIFTIRIERLNYKNNALLFGTENYVFIQREGADCLLTTRLLHVLR